MTAQLPGPPPRTMGVKSGGGFTSGLLTPFLILLLILASVLP